MHYVYILYSISANRYYVGETQNLDVRIDQHNTGFFKNSYTKRANDWALYFLIPCDDISIARKIEKHIKNMKSIVYIENLKKHQDISKKLIEKYSEK